MLGGENDLFKVEVTSGSQEVFDFKSFDFYFFDEPVVEGVKGVQDINGVVVDGVSG